LATPKRHWVTAKLVKRLLATPKRHWVTAKPGERLLATPKRHWVAAKLVKRLLATPKRHLAAAKTESSNASQIALNSKGPSALAVANTQVWLVWQSVKFVIKPF
jgi:hypothetical protein